jgi:hypothetical protein
MARRTELRMTVTRTVAALFRRANDPGLTAAFDLIACSVGAFSHERNGAPPKVRIEQIVFVIRKTLLAAYWVWAKNRRRTF